MPMAQNRFVPYEMKKSVIKVFGNENRSISGVLINPYFKDEIHFKSTTQLLRLIEHLQDSISFPEKSMLTRSFENGAEPPERFMAVSGEIPAGLRPLASFEISVLFRQNASWQGSIVWLDNASSAEFRSALEMIFLIDSVLPET